MFLKKNIWLIFYILLLLGVIYLFITLNSLWGNIQQKNNSDINYINRIFTASVKSTLDQQEIMLDLLGHRLMDLPQPLDQNLSTRLLDQTLSRNPTLVGFGLFDPAGNFITGSSNIDPAKMPNLKQNEKTRATFIAALASEYIELGDSYYQPALKHWVLPIRKAILDQNAQPIAVMTAGINPTNLLPAITDSDLQSLPLVHILLKDKTFKRLYLSNGFPEAAIRKHLQQPVPPEIIKRNLDAIQQQLGLSLEQLRKIKVPITYQVTSSRGNKLVTSLLYIPKYKMWSLLNLPKQHLTDKFWSSARPLSISLLTMFIIIYLLFRTIDHSDKKTRQQLIKQANHDFLTGLYNRQYLKKLEPDWVKQHGDGFFTFFLDLDNFKNINDSYGHSIGDAILKQVADRLVSNLDGNDIICRQGGDEFIILSALATAADVSSKADKLLTAIFQPYLIDNYQFNIGGSIGICHYPEDGQTFSELFSAADAAMYQAKQTRNSYFIFTKTLREKAVRKAQIEQALHSALNKKEIFLTYQPQMNRLGTPYGVETLIRWKHPELGIISPLEFIPIAEDDGLICDIGNFVIEQALADIAAWSFQHDEFDLQLSINISVRQLLESRFLAYLKKSLRKHKFPSSKLTLEITESIFINDLNYILPILEEIRSYGIKISLDDFGTGYSSLSMLKNLPIDELKIDKSFIDNIALNSQDKKLLGNILEIAANLGMKVVAEGVENEEQSIILKTYHCDFQQGYFHARPLTYADLTLFLQRF